MHKSNRLFHGTLRATPKQSCKWFCLITAIALLATSICLPLWAKTNRRGDGMMGDIGDGIRDFGRDVSDMVDPDNNGVLPDGSIDNGIANDGNQNNTPNTPGNDDNTPGTTQQPSDNTTAVTTDRAPETTMDTTRPADTSSPDGTRPNGAPDGDVSGNAQDGNTTNDTNDTADTTDEGGFPWAGIIIALVIVAAVILLIVMLLPRKDRHNR